MKTLMMTKMKNRLIHTGAALLLLFGVTLHAGFDRGGIQEEMWGFAKAHTAKKKNNKEWYIRLSVSAPSEGLKDRSNILGQLADSQEGYDSHDLPEMLSGYAPYLNLYFPHEEWERKDTLYASDYRSLSRKRRVTWPFTVRSDDPGRTITLEGSQPKLPSNTQSATKQQKKIEKLMKQMWLKEVSSGNYYPAYEEGKALSHTFEMGGESTKEFEWIYDKTGKSRRIYRKQQRNASKAQKKPSKPSERMETVKQRRGTHELDLPPGMGKR